MPFTPDAEFARLSLKMGYLTQDQVDGLKRRQAEVLKMGARLAYAEIAAKDLLLMPQQIEKVHLAAEYLRMLQKEQNFGALAVKKGFASDDEIAFCIENQKIEFASQRSLPRPLSEIMLEAEVISPERLAELEEEFRKLEVAADQRTMPFDPARVADDSPSGTRVVAPLSAPPGTEEVVEPSGEMLARPASARQPSSGLMKSARPPGAGAAPHPAIFGETRRTSARLIMTAEDGLDGTFSLKGPPVTIGRATTCAIRIDDHRASREHARVEYDESLKHHMISDLGSRNGTIVNGVKIESATALKPGDTFMIGATKFKYEA